MKDEEFIELFEIFRVLNKRWVQEWNKLSRNEHSVAQAMVLEILDSEGKQKPTNLSSTLAITTGGITGIVDKLVNEGLVKKSRDNKDRRVVFVEITEKGSELLTVLRQNRAQLMKEFLASLSLEEMQELLKLNRKLYANG